MNKMKKALLMTLCAGCLIITTVFGTLAYLTDKDSVVNTFTVGNVGITLDEAKVKPDGTHENGHDTRVKTNEYHLIPGHTYYKDPTVTVDAGSEDAYVRMIVTVKNIDQLKAALPTSENVTDDGGNETEVKFPENEKFYGKDGIFLLQMLCGGWDPATWLFEGYTQFSDGKTGTYEFRYKEIVKKDAIKATVLDDLFETITVPGEIDNEHLTYLAGVEIVVTAHAIQAAGFADEGAAWEAFNEQISNQ